MKPVAPSLGVILASSYSPNTGSTTTNSKHTVIQCDGFKMSFSVCTFQNNGGDLTGYAGKAGYLSAIKLRVART